MTPYSPLNTSPTVDLLLDAEEQLLAQKKHGLNKLVFGVLLKHFRLKYCFPSNDEPPSEELISLLAKQLIHINSIETLNKFNWEKRSVERFRKEIRDFLSVKKFRISDGDVLMNWLIRDVLKEGLSLEQCEKRAMVFFENRKIELPRAYQLKKYVHSAYSQFEKEFFERIEAGLSKEIKTNLMQLLEHEDDGVIEDELESDLVQLRDLKKDPSDISLKSIQSEITKLNYLEKLALPSILFSKESQKLLQRYYTRIMSSYPSEILKYSSVTRYALMAIFCYVASQRIIDTFTEILIRRIQLIETNAEHKMAVKYLKEIIKVDGKMDILLKLANASVESPQGVVEDVIYPEVSEETLINLVNELQHKGNKWFDSQVKQKMGSMYSHYCYVSV